jgi:hypothetical protein
VALRGRPLPDDEQGGAEESVEGVGGGFVFGDGGFDGLLGGGALVAEIEKRGHDVVGCRTGGGDRRCGGHVVELVFQFDDEALGEFFTDAGNAGEGGVILSADGLDGAFGIEAAEDGDGKFGADSADGDEALEEALLGEFEKAEEGEDIFAHLGVDVEGDFGVFGGQGGKGRDADDDVVADSAGLDDGLAGLLREEASAEMGDHGAIVVDGGVEKGSLSENPTSWGAFTNSHGVLHRRAPAEDLTFARESFDAGTEW